MTTTETAYMTTTETVYIIGGAFGASRKLSDYPEGSRLLECEHCKTPTIFAPSSLSHPSAGVGSFICMGCAAKLETPKSMTAVSFVQISPEQREELRSRGIDPDHAARMLEEMGPQGIIEAMERMQKVPPRMRRPDDDELGQLQQTALAAVIHDNPEILGSLPPCAVLALAEELIELRAALAGGVEDVIGAARAMSACHSIADRPNDQTLAELLELWRDIVKTGGPHQLVPLRVLTMCVLVEELIELRKAPRA